jgi:hypothetical protein
MLNGSKFGLLSSFWKWKLIFELGNFYLTKISYWVFLYEQGLKNLMSSLES